jgi:hypothetical protein
MADLELFSFENEDIKGGVFEKYKGKKNETHRIAIIYTDPKAMFAGQKIHYKDRYFLCKKGKCCEVLGPAKWRVGAVIIKYSTDKMGTPKKPFGFDLYPWIFGEQTYAKLKGVNSEFPLATHDMKITCDNEEYQHLNPMACQESIWTSKEELKTMVLEQAKPYWESVKRSIASDLSVEEINELLGLTTPAGTDPSTKLNLDSVLDSV